MFVMKFSGNWDSVDVGSFRIMKKGILTGVRFAWKTIFVAHFI